ncbi:hypothetical protein [Prosthecomicrobium pneumaticum]|uniref:Uncharacterized protein n=1 Tax=Prosthecomicrobium pneumaticum TaxID=81895 RepID=A0A7W9CW97_9HYPH|nr:hypothetical protein [Prosthecomicrobium pneumaticum]MBB5752676.1 hypothetical protein [Prosthecomicrobium pneumaticum]
MNISDGDGDDRHAIAAYIASLSAELKMMASRAGLGMLAYLLAMAEQEARQPGDGPHGRR